MLEKEFKMVEDPCTQKLNQMMEPKTIIFHKFPQTPMQKEVFKKNRVMAKSLLNANMHTSLS